MKTVQPSGKSKKPPEDKVEDLGVQLSQKVVGQPAVSEVIIPYIQMFQAGLAPEGRPVGVFCYWVLQERVRPRPWRR
jgi:ATP-dependent Clp protease ATP-binding subunit ClpA